MMNVENVVHLKRHTSKYQLLTELRFTIFVV